MTSKALIDFCTLFDQNYLHKGLALYYSLKAHCRGFTLWILCMDQATYRVLDRLHLGSVQLVEVESLKDEALLSTRPSRSPAEFCWTCTAPWVQHVLAHVPVDGLVAYLDADLFFYSDPSPIFAELDGGSILIHEHRFAPQYRSWEKTSGVFNVGLVAFRNDRAAHRCLSWWRARCLEACTLNADEGHCGDQKYLDDWPSRFPGVLVLQHKGAGVAPWNIGNYAITGGKGGVTVDGSPLVFYHFHSFKLTARRVLGRRIAIASPSYQFTRKQLALIYRPYLRTLNRADDVIRAIEPGFKAGLQPLSWSEAARCWLRGSLVLE